MNKTRLFLIIIITLLMAGNIFFAVMYSLAKLESAQFKNQLKNQQSNEKALYFARLFIDKVLSGEGEVDFEDRLKLENAVRDINDQKIFDQWQTFANSQSDKEVQASAGQLLNLLFEKVGQ